jgi:hypothetical protein
MVGFVVFKLSCMPKPSEIFVTPYERKYYINFNQRPVKIDYSHDIYPLSHLAALIEKIKARGEFSIRYLVDIANVMWFALEGVPNATTPAHWQMTGEYQSTAKCLAAGNIYFSADYKEIILINHKSGDFRPDFDSLQIALAILAKNRAVLTSMSLKLAAELSIEALSSSGGHESTFKIKWTDLCSWVDDKFDNPYSQPIIIKTFSAKNTHKRGGSNSYDESDGDSEDSETEYRMSGQGSKRRRIDESGLHKFRLTGLVSSMPARSEGIAGFSPLALFTSEPTASEEMEEACAGTGSMGEGGGPRREGEAFAGAGSLGGSSRPEALAGAGTGGACQPAAINTKLLFWITAKKMGEANEASSAMHHTPAI